MCGSRDGYSLLVISQFCFVIVFITLVCSIVAIVSYETRLFWRSSVVGWMKVKRSCIRFSLFSSINQFRFDIQQIWFTCSWLCSHMCFSYYHVDHLWWCLTNNLGSKTERIKKSQGCLIHLYKKETLFVHEPNQALLLMTIGSIGWTKVDLRYLNVWNLNIDTVATWMRDICNVFTTWWHHTSCR
jgi:lysylphosphatidylglycerol synthetase-like protein (DUF2156 family)